MRRACFTFLLSCIWQASALPQGLPRARPADVGLSVAALERIPPALQAYVDSGKLPGLLAVIARYGKLAYVASDGSMDLEHRHPMKPDHVIRLFYLPKPITSNAIKQPYD